VWWGPSNRDYEDIRQWLREHPHNAVHTMNMIGSAVRTMEGLHILRAEILETFEPDHACFQYATSTYCGILLEQDKSDPHYHWAARVGIMCYLKTWSFIRFHRMDSMIKEYVRTKWAVIRSCVKLLSLHHRAVVTANHPLRKLERGEFK